MSKKRKASSFNDLLTTFKKVHLPTVSDGTRLRYELDIDQRIRPEFGELRLSRISRLTIETFRSRIMRDLSPKSVNNCIDLLKLLFKKAVEWELLDKNPATNVRPLKLADMKYQWWDRKSDITRFLARAKRSPYYAAYKLALECGLRLGEIIGLDKADVDLRRCRLHIHQQWLERQKRLGPTKGRRARVVGFSPKSDLRRELAKAILKSPHRSAIFVSPTGRRIYASKIRTKEFEKLIRAAGVPRIRFHDLRHTFASWYMIEHDDIWSLRKILGHRDVQTTQRYAHLSTRHLKAQALVW
jgi:integrase